MDDASRAWFESLLPDGPGISSRPMFGNRAGFVNGNMFLALLGQDVAVRLPEEDPGEGQGVGRALPRVGCLDAPEERRGEEEALAAPDGHPQGRRVR